MAKKTRHQSILEQLKLVGNVQTERQPSTKWTRVTYNHHVLTGAPIEREQDYYLWVSRSNGMMRRGPTLFGSTSCPETMVQAIIRAGKAES